MFGRPSGAGSARGSHVSLDFRRTLPETCRVGLDASAKVHARPALMLICGAAPLSDPPHICGAGLTPGHTGVGCSDLCRLLSVSATTARPGACMLLSSAVLKKHIRECR